MDYECAQAKQSFQGDNYYLGDNLGSEAIITYYLKEKITSKQDQRREAEKKAKEDNQNVAYPSYDQLKTERDEPKPYILFEFNDVNGNIVRKLKTKPEKGIQRISWDLRYAPKDPIDLSSPSFYNPFGGSDQGTLVAPGTYTVTMYKNADGKTTQLGGPVQLKVRALSNTVLPASNRDALVSFQQQVQKLGGMLGAARRTLSEINNQMRHIKEAAIRAEVAQDDLMADVLTIENKSRDISYQLNGDPVARTLDIAAPPSIGSRIRSIMYESYYSTSGPTKTHQDTYAIAIEEFKPVYEELRILVNTDLKNLHDKLSAVGAPYTPYSLPELVEFEN